MIINHDHIIFYNYIGKQRFRIINDIRQNSSSGISLIYLLIYKQHKG